MKTTNDRFSAKPRRSSTKPRRRKSSTPSLPSHFELLKSIIGAVKNGPGDLARNHTHYAHGGKRR